MYKELVNNLREHAEWAEANEWETPITLGDDLAQAAEAIERLLSERREMMDLLSDITQKYDTCVKIQCQMTEVSNALRAGLERNCGCEYCYTDAKSNPFVGGYNYCPMCGRELKGADNG